jgi:AcrR family transcriptional regulator
MPRRSREVAAMTRASVLNRAAALGSIEGLERLSIGRLASELGLSKSGVIGHFESKEDLQLATVAEAVMRFRAEIWEPISDREPGLARLRALMDAWLSYLDREVFPGGCFLTAASFEFDGRPGAVRAAIADAWRRWLALIEMDAAVAQTRGELDTDLTPRQIAYQLHASVGEANWAKQLLGAPDALDLSRAAISRLLRPKTAEH